MVEPAWAVYGHPHSGMSTQNNDQMQTVQKRPEFQGWDSGHTESLVDMGKEYYKEAGWPFLFPFLPSSLLPTP